MATSLEILLHGKRRLAAAMAIATTGALVYFIADLAILAIFDQRLWLLDLAKYLPQWRVWLPFWPSLLLFILVSGMLFSVSLLRIRTPVPASQRRGLASAFFGLGALAFGLGYPEADASVARYAFGRAFLERRFWSDTFDSLRAATAREKSDGDGACEVDCEVVRRLATDVLPPPARANVILLVVESFGAVSSNLLSGIHDVVPNFDGLSAQGTLFTQYLATGENSLNGLLALAGGVVPIPDVRWRYDRDGYFERIGLFPGPVRGLSALGYETRFVSSFRWFNDESLHVARATGFSRIDWPGNDAELAMASNAQFVPDQKFYRRVRNIVREWRGRRGHFLMLWTADMHGGRPSSAAWRTVDRNLSEFVAVLQGMGYFDGGWLLITGDHRPPAPLSERELARYGSSARARVPLLAIGAGIPRGMKDDRLFSHADLLRKLGALPNRSRRFTDVAVFVEYFGDENVPITLFRQLPDASLFSSAATVRMGELLWRTLPGDPHFESAWHEQTPRRRTLDCLARGRAHASFCGVF
jgi:hypothetical protein